MCSRVRPTRTLGFSLRNSDRRDTTNRRKQRDPSLNTRPHCRPPRSSRIDRSRTLRGSRRAHIVHAKSDPPRLVLIHFLLFSPVVCRSIIFLYLAHRTFSHTSVLHFFPCRACINYLLVSIIHLFIYFFFFFRKRTSSPFRDGSKLYPAIYSDVLLHYALFIVKHATALLHLTLFIVLLQAMENIIFKYSCPFMSILQFIICQVC